MPTRRGSAYISKPWLTTQRASITLTAVLMLGAVGASTASAAAPEFRHRGGEVVKRKFKSTTGVAKLDAAGTVVTCASSSTAEGAEIEKGNAAKEQKNVKGVVVTFKKCESENSKGEKCKVHSKGKVEEIKTESLSGELGKVAKAEAESEVGLDLKPTFGKIFVTLEGTCLPISPSPVEGSVIGEPSRKEELKGKLVFATFGGRQRIQQFEGGFKDTLEAFKISEATEETTATITFEETVEVGGSGGGGGSNFSIGASPKTLVGAGNATFSIENTSNNNAKVEKITVSDKGGEFGFVPKEVSACLGTYTPKAACNWTVDYLGKKADSITFTLEDENHHTGSETVSGTP